MIRKIMVILLTCLILTAFISCGRTGTDDTVPNSAPVSAPPEPAADAKTLAYNTYAAVAGKLAADSGGEYDIDYTVNMEIIAPEQSPAEIGVTGNIKMKTVGDKVQCAIVIDMGEYGLMGMYSDGEKAFAMMDDETMEIEMTSLMNQMTSTLNIPDFGENAVKEYSSEEMEHGKLTSLVINGEMLTSFAGDVMDTVGIGLSEMDMELKLSDVTMNILTDTDGNPLTMHMTLTMQIAIDGSTLETNAEYEYVFNKLGSGVTIELPVLTA